MASLYRKPIVKRDPKTGEKIKAKSRKWWGRFRDVDGLERRVPLARDKAAAQAMLNALVHRVEREKVGLADPSDKHSAKPLKQHANDFEAYLRGKENSDSHCTQTASYSRFVIRKCKFRKIGDISASKVQKCIAGLRRNELSISTCNHYLRAIKGFTRWLVRDRRTKEDRLVHMTLMNEDTDRRHDRRALAAEEFTRLIEAAKEGPPIETICGQDRIIMYVLAAWTGFRKREIGSLTMQSFCLDDETVTVAAAYSKRKRNDVQILHPAVACLLKDWLAKKPDLAPDEILFPVSAKITGVERRTSKMMRLDLASAREKWIEEAETEQEKKKREKSDFLKYRDSGGLYADFHANRHTFISNLTLAGVSPKLAQTLARHSDINLTMQVYTHIGKDERTAAIAALPAPPVG